jgi:ferredoxin
MAYTISDECVSCGACASNCPVDAISQGGSHYEIDAGVCVECGSCAESCPMSAITA